jgi:hypothetical protein
LLRFRVSRISFALSYQLYFGDTPKKFAIMSPQPSLRFDLHRSPALYQFGLRRITKGQKYMAAMADARSPVGGRYCYVDGGARRHLAYAFCGPRVAVLIRPPFLLTIPAERWQEEFTGRMQMNRRQHGANHQAYPDCGGPNRDIGLRAVAAAIRYQGDSNNAEYDADAGLEERHRFLRQR